MKLKKLLLMFLLAIAGQTFADEMSVSPVTINAGETKIVEVNLNISANTYAAMQFEIVLPKGLSIPKNNNGNLNVALTTNHVTVDDFSGDKSHSMGASEIASDENSTTYQVIIYSTNNSYLVGGSGPIIRFQMQADNSVNGLLNASIKNIILAASGGSGGVGETGRTTLSNASFENTVHTQTVSITMGDAGDAYWSTYYNSIDNMSAPEGTQVFSASLSGSELTLTLVPDRIIKAGKGVILKSTGASVTLTLTEDPATDSYYTNNCLEGTEVTIPNPDPGNVYVLGNGSAGIGFYKLSNQGSIGAKKAYLISSNAAREIISFNDLSGIGSIVSEESLPSVVFDLQGRRVEHPKSGIYIVNGKKVIIK